MKTCPKCGSIVNDSNTFCQKCGFSFTNAEPPINVPNDDIYLNQPPIQNVPMVRMARENKMSKNPGRSSGVSSLILGIVALVIFLIAFYEVLFYPVSHGEAGRFIYRLSVFIGIPSIVSIVLGFYAFSRDYKQMQSVLGITFGVIGLVGFVASIFIVIAS